MDASVPAVVRVRWIAGRMPGRLAAACLACLIVGSLVSCGHDGSGAGSAGSDRIPLPKQALLARQPEPKCTDAKAARFQGAVASATSDSQLAQSGSNPELSQRIRLEYERDCFRRAEAQARERLSQLQKAVGATVKAVKRAEETDR